MYKNQKNLTFTNRLFKNVVVKLIHCTGVSFQGCTFQNASLYFVQCKQIAVQRCAFLQTNTTHALQCNQSSNITISYNYFEEPIGTSKVVDIINLFKSNKAVVSYNYLTGGGPNRSGGGIMLGDNMGNDQEASNNICVNCGQYGIAIAGGDNNRILNNTIMGTAHPWSNVGLYVWGIPQRKSKVTNAQVIGNKISWKKRDGSNNPIWINATGTIQRNNQLNVPYSPPPPPI